MGFKLRREAVERDQQRRALARDLLGDAAMIGLPEPLHTRDPLIVINGIAGDGVAVACDGDGVRRIFFAVQIDDQPGNTTKNARAAKLRAQLLPKLCNSQINRDMGDEQGRRYAKVQVGRNMVGSVIRDQQQGAVLRTINIDPGFFHRPLLPWTARNVTIPKQPDQENSRMRMTRRTALAALAVAPAFPTAAKKKKRPVPVAPPEPGPFADMAERLLAHLKETGTYNGTAGALDGGPLARSLDDYSPVGEAAMRAEIKAGRELLMRVKFAGGERMSTNLAVVSATLENGTRSADIPYGRINPFNFSGHVPYLVSQIAGPHIDGINVMMEQQSLGTAKAVDAWLEKLDGFPQAFAGVVEKIRADRAAGCMPPRALLEKTLPVLDAFLAGKAADLPLARAFAARTAEAGLSRRMRTTGMRRANTLIERRARPAVAALRAEIAAMIPQGRPEAGVWAQPMGAEFYAANVRALGDTPLSPDEIHRIGIDEVARIAGEMNAHLTRMGMPDGSIGARMTALARDPANQFPDSDAGREALLDYVRAKVAGAEARYAELLPAHLIPRQPLVVKRVPVATQASAPGGFYDGPSLDGTRPGTYWINLRDMAAVAKFRLPTLSYHEGVPGHHTQGSIATALGEAPLLIRIASFNAYQEGWALYAERLMAELGFYKDDPLGDLGRLQDELFRAVRLVVDTGLHHKRWTREQAIRTMVDITGIAETRVTAEIERYMAWPAQALGYKLGQLRLLDMRKRYLAKGKGADTKTFHGIVLAEGGMPLDLVEGRLGIG